MHATTTADAHEWQEEDAGRIGVWLFLVSEVLLFGAFLASYFAARLGNADCALGVVAWPDSSRLPGLALATLNTLILLTSSYTAVRAISRAHRGDAAGLRTNLLVTLGLGTAFLGVKAAEYAMKINHHLYPGSELVAASPGLSIFLTYYFAMTILHALHVIVGLVWMGLVLSAARRGATADVARKAEYAGLYWHFVDVVWVFLFPLLYLI